MITLMGDTPKETTTKQTDKKLPKLREVKKKYILELARIELASCTEEYPLPLAGTLGGMEESPIACMLDHLTTTPFAIE
jgi:hypothetical protein